MSIYRLQQSKILREHGKRLGRAGMSQRVFDLVDKFMENRTYKNAMNLAGRLQAIAMAARCDCYWDEKVRGGFQSEFYQIQEYEKPTEESAQAQVSKILEVSDGRND